MMTVWRWFGRKMEREMRVHTRPAWLVFNRPSCNDERGSADAQSANIYVSKSLTKIFRSTLTKRETNKKPLCRVRCVVLPSGIHKSKRQCDPKLSVRQLRNILLHSLAIQTSSSEQKIQKIKHTNSIHVAASRFARKFAVNLSQRRHDLDVCCNRESTPSDLTSDFSFVSLHMPLSLAHSLFRSFLFAYIAHTARVSAS